MSDMRDFDYREGGEPFDMDFDEWRDEVDEEVVYRLGVGIDDLPDRPYWDYFEAGRTPDEVAREIEREELDGYDEDEDFGPFPDLF